MTLWDSVPSLDLERSWDSNPLGSTTTADKPCLYALEPKMGLETPCFDGLSTSGLHSARFPAILSTYPERDFLTRTLGLSVSLGDLVIWLGGVVLSDSLGSCRTVGHCLLWDSCFSRGEHGPKRHGGQANVARLSPI